MSELGITPTARSRLPDIADGESTSTPIEIRLVPLTSRVGEDDSDESDAANVIEIDERI